MREEKRSLISWPHTATVSKSRSPLLPFHTFYFILSIEQGSKVTWDVFTNTMTGLWSHKTLISLPSIKFVIPQKRADLRIFILLFTACSRLFQALLRVKYKRTKLLYWVLEVSRKVKCCSCCAFSVAELWVNLIKRQDLSLLEREVKKVEAGDVETTEEISAFPFGKQSWVKQECCLECFGGILKSFPDVGLPACICNEREAEGWLTVPLCRPVCSPYRSTSNCCSIRAITLTLPHAHSTSPFLRLALAASIHHLLKCLSSYTLASHMRTSHISFPHSLILFFSSFFLSILYFLQLCA